MRNTGALSDPSALAVTSDRTGDSSSPDLIPVAGCTGIEVIKSAGNPGTTYAGRVAGYDSSGTFIGVVLALPNATAATTWRCTLPDDCAYIRIGVYGYPVYEWYAFFS